MTDHATQAAELSLAADFPTPTEEQWETEVLRVLNRRRPEGKHLNIEQAYQRLTSTTVDGLVTKPLYRQDDGNEYLGYPGLAPFTRGTTIRSGEMLDGWQIVQLHEHPDAKTSKAAVLTDLERGCNGVWLRLDPDAISPADVATVLSGVQLELATVHVSSHTDQFGAAKALLATIPAGDEANALGGSLGIDPIGYAAMHGLTPDLTQVPAAIKLAEGFPTFKPLVVDATVFHNAGAGDVQELAYALATGVTYLRAAVEAGISVDDAAEAILFRVSATTEQFLTISRLRALRTLWSRVGEVAGVTASKRGAVQHAVTSLRNLSRDDAYVNVLRATLSSFAASVGGADIQTVLPLDTVVGLPNDLTRRIARNTQVILAEESNLGRVNDPGGGAWYVESMTRQLTERAWELFTSLEDPGFDQLLADGTIAAQLAETNAERAKRLAKRTLPLTGVSMFPNMHEDDLEREPRPAATELAGLKPVRDSQVFEDLRDRSRAAREAGNAPVVMLACLGTRRDFGARESFTSNLYHVGGIDTIVAEGSEPDDFVRQLTEAGAKVAVLCSSAGVYAEQALPVATALKQAGAIEIRLAGQLKEIGAPDDDGVIDATVFAGMDVVELLTKTLDKLEA